MGMSEVQLLARVEVPVALPVVLAGSQIIGGGDHGNRPTDEHRRRRHAGNYILGGLALSDEVEVFAAALLVVALALMTEVGFALLERRMTSPGLTGSDAGLTLPQRVFGDSPARETAT